MRQMKSAIGRLLFYNHIFEESELVLIINSKVLQANC